MGKKWFLQVTEFPSLTDQFYRTKITDLSRLGKTAFKVTLELASTEQVGRKIDIELPLPIRPQGLATNLFNCCGFHLKANDEFNPKDAIGREVM